MRKSVSYTILILTLFLVACGRNRPQTDEHYPSYQNYEIDNYYGATTLAGEAVFSVGEPNPPEPTIKDLLLYDLDYLMQLFEDAYSYINVLYRTRGIDIRVLGQNAREIIENYPYSMQEFAYSLGISLEDMPELDAQVFWGILRGEIFHPAFFPFFAHTQITNFYTFRVHSTWNRRDSSIPRIRFNRRAFDNITSALFYREMDILWSNLLDDPALFQFYFRLAPLQNEASEIQVVNTSAITATILEEGRVAYLQVSSFMQDMWEFDREHSGTFIDFYNAIQDYEHLIIDIRDNTGGGLELPITHIMLPLSPEPDNLPNMPLYILYTGSELGRRFSELDVESMHIPEYRPSQFPQSYSPLLIEEILNTGSLSSLNTDDLHLLVYGYRIYHSVMGLNNSRFALPHIPFSGQMWLLICSRNYSAAAMFARFARYTGFATLVGEPVGGAYAVTIATPMPLPNTGIVVVWDVGFITDVYGRALNEFPTQPHYFNRPGMDALETVLAMIAESRG